MIKAVIFDIDGVLLDSFETNLKFFQDLMIRFGYTPPTRETYLKLFHLTMRTTIGILANTSAEEEIEKIWNAGRMREVPYHAELLRIPDGARETLDILRGQYALGIATSRVKESLHSSPQIVELQKYFLAVVAFQDTERHKPYPDPLLFVAEKLGVRPEECVYIGDVENDILAARAAGMKAVVYSQHQFDTADACTSDFRALPNIIATL